MKNAKSNWVLLSYARGIYKVDPRGREPLKPYQTILELEEKVSAVFYKVDPELGNYFEIMRSQGLLDLENRKGKAPGARPQ